MKNLKVNDCLFHGIRSTSKKTSFDVLEDILSSKFILTHEDLRKKGICHEREFFCYQGSNAVSVCFHPRNHELYNQFKDSGITLANEEGAFCQFINTCYPSIILSSDLLEALKYRTFGGYYRMEDEIQVLSSIPLEYMTAIGYGTFKNQREIERQNDLRKLKEILEKYNYHVPIVHPIDGEVYKITKKCY